MQIFQIIVIISIFTKCLVFCDQSVQASSLSKKSADVQQNADSIKTKRGIHGFAGLRYLPPAPAYIGHNHIKHTPYSSFPGRIYTRPAGPAYALTPGNAVVHSYNAHYPRIYPRLRPSIPAPFPPPPPPPVFIHSKPIVPSVPVYTNARYPVFVQKPFVVPRPIVPLPPPVTQFAVPNFVSTHIPTAHSLPVPLPPFPLQPTTIISENGWKPLYSPIPSIHSPIPTSTIPFAPPSHSHLNLAPSNPSIHRPSNYYLPVDPLPPAHDVTAHSANHENGTVFLFKMQITTKKWAILPKNSLDFCNITKKKNQITLIRFAIRFFLQSIISNMIFNRICNTWEKFKRSNTIKISYAANTMMESFCHYQNKVCTSR